MTYNLTWEQSMSDQHSEYSKAVKEFAGSEVFFKIFDETISLVQKSSDYLEGVGRFDQARLVGKDATLFATQSVKLTNCLMQISSWLLSHRAFYKGEISEVKNTNFEPYQDDEQEPMDSLMVSLPTRLVILITQTMALYERIIRMDRQLKNLNNVVEQIQDANHVHSQLQKIQQGLGISTKKIVEKQV